MTQTVSDSLVTAYHAGMIDMHCLQAHDVGGGALAESHQGASERDAQHSSQGW